MKTLRFLTLSAAIVLLTSWISAADPSAADTNNSLPAPLQNFISKTMYEPVVLINNGEHHFARVTFIVNDDGTLKIMQTNSSSGHVDEEVRKRFDRIIISDAKGYAGKTYSMVLNFNVRS